METRTPVRLRESRHRSFRHTSSGAEFCCPHREHSQPRRASMTPRRVCICVGREQVLVRNESFGASKKSTRRRGVVALQE